MLRGTRLQYVQRRSYFWLAFLVVTLVGLAVSMVLASDKGWSRILAEVTLLLASFCALLLIIFTTNKQWQKEQAELGRQINQHARGFYLPGGIPPLPRDYPKVRSFLRRLFQGKSD
jgi:hypothetical protein